MKKENLKFLEEKIQKINSTDILYPKTEIEEIQNPNNKVIILNGKYGSGKSSIIESIPNEHIKVTNISLLEDNLKYFKFNVYSKMKKNQSLFRKKYLSIFLILIILVFLFTYLKLKHASFITDVLFKIALTFMSTFFSAMLVVFLFNFEILNFLHKYELNNQEYFLYDIDDKIIKWMNNNNIVIAIEDVDRLEDRKITEFFSLLNSLVAKINKQLINENSKLIITIDLNIISEKNINLLNKSNFSIINITTHTNTFLCSWAKTKMSEYLNSISQEIFVEFPWILTIREFKKIIKDSISDFDFFKKSKFLSLFRSNLIDINFFLLKNLLVFSFKKEDILNKKVSWLLTKDYYKENDLNNKNKNDAVKEYINLNFGEIPLFLQELILDNIYLGIIGSTNDHNWFNYLNFYITNKLDYVPITNRLEFFLKIIEKRFKNIILPGLDYISLTLKKELLNLDTDFTNFDKVYVDLTLKIRSNFNDTEINYLVKLVKNITSTELDNELVGLDSYIKNKFNQYLNSNKSFSLSNQIIYQKIGLKFDKKNYLEYFKKVIKLGTPIYIDWKILNENIELQDLLSNQIFNSNLNKRFLISITNLIFDIINLDHSKNSNEIFLKLLEKDCFKEFQKELQEIYSTNSLATFFNSIVELFYLDKTKFGKDYYNEINKIIKEKRKEIKNNEIIYDEYGKIIYLLRPWHFITLETLWIIENFNNNYISIEKIKFIYDETSLNLEKLDGEFQSKVKEKINYLIDKLNLKFEKL